MNKLLVMLGATALLLGFWALVWGPGEIPLLDANRQVLATSKAEGFCAGTVYEKTRGRGDKFAMAECVAVSQYSTEIDLNKVQQYFCRGFFSRSGFPVQNCMDAVQGRRLWPTAVGSLTGSWNPRFPYPGEALIVDTNSNRGDTRDNEERTNDDIGRNDDTG